MLTLPRLLRLSLATLLVGGSFGLHAAPVSLTPSGFPGATQPQVAVAPGGAIHVAFGRKDDGSIHHVASRDHGRTFSQPVKIGALPKLGLGMRRGPRIAATDQLLAVSAISHEDGNLHAWTSSDAGATWRKVANINDVANSAREGLHAMTADGKGAVFATWLDLRNGSMELWAARSQDGGGTWSANALVYKSPDGHICECCHPSATMDAKGRVAVMWRNWLGGSRDMYAALSRDGGRTFAAAQKLGSGTWKLNGCPMDGGAVALDASGQPLTAWRREQTAFTSDAVANEQVLGEGALQPVVVAGRGGPLYLWQSGGGLMLRKGGGPARRFVEKGAFAAAAPLPSGRTVVVWQTDTALFADLVE